MQSHNAFSLYCQTSPTFSDISTPSSPPSSPPAIASLEQQLQEALASINGLTQRVESLTANLNILQTENQTLRGQPPAPVWTPFMPQPSYPPHSMFSPAPQPLPHHSPPQPSGFRPLPTPPHFTPSHILLHQTPPARSSFKDPEIASPLPFSSKREDTETFIHSCILYINGWPLEFGTEQNKVTWILSHMQTGSVHAWHEYVMAQIFKKTLWYNTVDELLQEIQCRFSDMDKQAMMSLKIRTMMQGDKMVDEHVQDFKKAALEAGYEGFSLIVEFKWSLHPALRKHLSEIRPQPVTIQEWYNESIIIDRQWRISKAEEAFYGKTNQSGAVRKPPQSQAGTSGVRNDSWQSYNNYGQGGYQNWGQSSTGSATVPRQDNRLGQKDPNTMDVDRTQEQRPPVKCYKCQKLGHMMKDCQASFNIWNMTYEELQDHFDQAEVAKKDRDAIRTKEKAQQDFPIATQWKHLHWSCRIVLKSSITMTHQNK